MYITKVEINHIRSISHFEMTFEKPAGWHVLIGDNGSGKTSILQAIALGIADRFTIADISFYTGLYTTNWVRQGTKSGGIIVVIQGNKEIDDHEEEYHPPTVDPNDPQNLNSNLLNISELEITPNYWGESTGGNRGYLIYKKNKAVNTKNKNVVKYGWFAASFGPFRRFKGDDGNLAKIEESAPRFAPHLSLFGESVAFPSTVEWLTNLHVKRLEKEAIETETLDALTTFINHSQIFPNGMKLESINSSGMFFKNEEGIVVELGQLSDGYRSVISLTFELIRQLIRAFDYKKVFAEVLKGSTSINLPGVVLIDEIDAHLHPTWQTRIGQWFTQYFPNIQFIVTTHSPLVCRACENGSIWRLAAPGSSNESGEVTGIERDRLIFGNILDAYGTEIFGKDITSDTTSKHMVEELAELNMKNTMGKISKEEKARMTHLRTIFTTDDTTQF